MHSSALTAEIKAKAITLGFDHCRVVPVTSTRHADFFEEWLTAGNNGEMAYLRRNRDKRRWPTRLADEQAPPFRSIIVVGVNHFQFALSETVRDDPGRGLIASYAWGDDYHEIIRPQLYALDSFIRGQTGRKAQGKCLVDTGPVLERDWAMESGLGFIGKNCCIIHPGDGSWLLLATILIPEELDYDQTPVPFHEVQPPATDVLGGLPPRQSYGEWIFRSSRSDIEKTITGTCGSCIRCLDACPTDAFIGPYHLDARRCISYWTIESRNPVPRELRPAFGNHIFGCDICQEICPWNHRLDERKPSMPGLAVRNERVAPFLLDGFDSAHPYWLDQTAFSTRFRRSPVKRAKRSGMLRNVCVALGNWADPSTVPALVKALDDEEPLGRGHAAWALGRVMTHHGLSSITPILSQRLAIEDDSWVREEISLALGGQT